MESKGYPCGYIQVVNSVSFRTSKRMSHEDMADFENEFGQKMRLEGVSYGQQGGIKEYKYLCDHELLKEFRDKLNGWIRNSDCLVSFIIVTDSISLYAYGELSEGQIRGIERNFELTCRGYEKTCNSGEIHYKFG